MGAMLLSPLCDLWALMFWIVDGIGEYSDFHDEKRKKDVLVVLELEALS